MWLQVVAYRGELSLFHLSQLFKAKLSSTLKTQWATCKHQINCTGGPFQVLLHYIKLSTLLTLLVIEEKNMFVWFCISHTNNRISKAYLKCSLAFPIIATSMSSMKRSKWGAHTKLAPVSSRMNVFPNRAGQGKQKDLFQRSQQTFPSPFKRAHWFHWSLGFPERNRKWLKIKLEGDRTPGLPRSADLKQRKTAHFGFTTSISKIALAQPFATWWGKPLTLSESHLDTP